MKNHFSLRLQTLTLSSLLTASGICSAAGTATNGSSMVKNEIRQLAGCYSVTYQNTETFSPNKEYAFRDRFKTKSLELVVVDEESDHSIELQHLLLIPGMPGGGVMKHWRQNWEQGAVSEFQFMGEDTWQRISQAQNSAATAGSPFRPQDFWRQEVTQVDDSPRYECSAPWIKWGNQSFWECTTSAPLPRREFTTRNDYNILERRNRHQLTAFGHAHEEDNYKINRDLEAKTQVVIAEEKGKNNYVRQALEKCGAGQLWWSKHKAFWDDVRIVWKELRQSENVLSFQAKNDDQTLYEKLGDLDEKTTSAVAAGTAYDSNKVQSEVRAIVRAFLK
jgi:hypothetical protein